MKKHKRKYLVSLGTLEKHESIDCWLNQFERGLDVLTTGIVLIAHFASKYLLKVIPV